jgi:phosphoglycerate kinase
VAITKFLPSYAGLLFQQELSALEMVLKGANHPVIAILGGKKVSTKYKLIQNIADKVDYIILGGAMANTALASLGYDMGKSYVEYEFLDEVKDLVQKIGLQKLRLPNDFIVQNIGAIEARNLDSLKKEDMIGDIGPKTVIQWNNLINQCKTLVWNGPMGIYENPHFNKASEDMADYISNRTNNGKLFSLVGGGDLVAVIRKMGSEQNFSYVSTAGGAFLSLLSGEDLPGIQSLKRDLN